MSNALRKYAENQFASFTVAPAAAVTRGFLVSLVLSPVGGPVTIQNSVAPDTGIGVAMQSGAAGAVVKCYLFGSIVDVLVGTGGATFGIKARWAAANDGFVDSPATTNAGANTDPIFGTFLQTGLAGERVGLLVPGSSNRIRT